MFSKHLVNKLLLSKYNKSLRLINRCFANGMGKQRIMSSDRIYMNKKQTSDLNLYINDKTLAKMVSKHLSKDLPNDKSIIFDSSPGTGLLAKHLLESGAQTVRVFEEEVNHLIELNRLKNLYPKQLEIIEKSLLNLPNIKWKYWLTEEQDLNSLFSDVPNNGWRSLPSIKFVSVLSPHISVKFLRFIIRELTQFDSFFSVGRTQFLVFISEKEYNYMTAKSSQNFSSYRSCTVLYNSLFDIEILETVPYSDFTVFPPLKNSKKKIEGNAKLVRLTPKIFLDEFDSEMLMDYHYFVTQTFMKRKNWIIPFLEKWFPNCGPQLIKMGIPVFKYFGDLTPQEVFDLFRHFVNQPDYDTSLFKSYAINHNHYFTPDKDEVDRENIGHEADHESDHESDHEIED